MSNRQGFSPAGHAARDQGYSLLRDMIRGALVDWEPDPSDPVESATDANARIAVVVGKVAAMTGQSPVWTATAAAGLLALDLHNARHAAGRHRNTDTDTEGSTTP